MKRLVTQHPVGTYFLATFALSWGGVLLAVRGAVRATPVKAQDNPLFVWIVLAMLAGPTVTALALTTLFEGRPGLLEFRSRLARWRVSSGWYAVALLAAPLSALAVSAAMSRLSSDFHPALHVVSNRWASVELAVVVGLSAGFFEELGWTGFAVPRLMRRYGVGATGLIVGVLWSAWHLLVVIWGIGNRAGTVPLVAFVAIDGLATLPAFRVLMVRVYARTRSLFLAILMHASLTAATLTITPRVTGIDLLAYDLALALVIWSIARAVDVPDQATFALTQLRDRVVRQTT